MFRAVRIRLSLYYAGSLAAILVAIGLTAYFVLRNSLDSEINDSIRATYAEFATKYYPPPPNNGGRGGVPRSGDYDDGDYPANGDSYKYDDFRTKTTDVFIVFTDSGGDITSNPRQVPVALFSFQDLAGSADSDGTWSDVEIDGDSYRLASYISPNGDYIHIGRSLAARNAQLEKLTLVMLTGGLAGIVLAGGGGLWLAGRSLVPIRRSFEMQRRFVSDASHELRTPIAVVQANNELMLRHPEQTIEENIDQAEAIAIETEHLTRLIGDLLTLARGDEGRLALEKVDIDLDDLMSELGRDVAPLAESRGLTFKTELAPVRVEGDRQRIRQLAFILLDNAIKYTPAGGTVTLSTRRNGRKAELTVLDTGPGIATEHHHRLFDRFFRIDDARTHSVSGTGLGLAIAKLIAEANHGTLAVRSNPGQGATFTFRLPVKE